jgi:hypothetical protein
MELEPSVRGVADVVERHIGSGIAISAGKTED